MKIKTLSFPFICFLEYGLFNGLQTIQIKISFPAQLASRVVSNRRKPLLAPGRRARPIVFGRVIIAEDYSSDFCLIQEKSSSSRLTLAPANPRGDAPRGVSKEGRSVLTVVPSE